MNFTLLRRSPLVGFVLFLLVLLASHAKAYPSPGGPLASEGSSDQTCYAIPYSTANATIVRSNPPFGAESSQEDPRRDAGSKGGFCKVHTYFVAGKEGAPAVWVHNATLQQIGGYFGGYLRAARRAGRSALSWSQYRSRFLALAEAGSHAYEARAGIALESRLTGTLTRDASKAAEWIEQGTGRSFDLVLGKRIPSRALAAQIASGGLERQILRHMTYKADVTVISTFGMQGRNLRRVEELYERLRTAVPGKELWLGRF